MQHTDFRYTNNKSFIMLVMWIVMLLLNYKQQVALGVCWEA